MLQGIYCSNCSSPTRRSLAITITITIADGCTAFKAIKRIRSSAHDVRCLTEFLFPLRMLTDHQTLTVTLTLRVPVAAAAAAA